MVQSLFIPLQTSDLTIFFTTAFSIILASIVAYHFFKFYRVAGLNNLLGIPTGFAFLAASYTLVNIDLWITHGTELDNTVEWISLIVLSYGFSLLAISYHYKYTEFRDTARLIRKMSYALVPLMAMLAVVVLPTPQQELPPYQNEETYFAGFNMIALGYVLIQSFKGVFADGGSKLVYIPTAFALLWLGQFSTFTSSENVSVTDITKYPDIADIMKPEIASLAGLVVFTYALYNYVLRSGRIAKRATA